MAADNKSDEVFVAIRDSVNLRRDILECSRDIIGSLKKYQNLERLKTEKFNGINQLRSIIRDINRTISKLKGTLPKTKLKIVLPQQKQEKKAKEQEMSDVKEKKSEQPQETKKKLTEVDKLEAELSEIESRLNVLGGN